MPATTAATTTTVSEKKLAANRQNAQKSTGPRTPAGKRSAAQNALRHGGFAASTLLPHEDPAAFYNFRRAFIADLCPMTAPELFLADRAVSLAWRLQRLQEADAALYTAAELNVERHLERAKADLTREDDNHDLFDDEDDNDDDHTPEPLHPEVRALLEDPAGTPPIHPAFLLAASFERDQTHSPFDRLARAEQRLHGMYHRTFKELTLLQSRREKQSRDPNHHPTPCPFLPKEEPPAATNPDDPTPQPPTPPELQKSQNEPTDRAAEAPPEPGLREVEAGETPSEPGLREGEAPPEPGLREGEAPSEPRFTRGAQCEVERVSGPTPQNAQNEPTVPPRPLIATHETSAVPSGLRS